TLFCCEIFHEASSVESSVVRESIHRELSGVRMLVSVNSGNPRRLTCALSLPQGLDERRVFEFIADVVERNFGHRAAVVISSERAGALELAMTMRELQRLSNIRYAKNHVRVVALAQTPLNVLVNELRDDVRVHDLTVRFLEPLVHYDELHGAELVATLQAVLDHPAS